MLLGEALEEVASLAKRAESLRGRACSNARYQEGEQPPENAGDLAQQASEALSHRESLARRIQQTNAQTLLNEGTEGYYLSDALVERHTLAQLHSLYTSVADAASGDRYGYGPRHSRSELKNVTDIDVNTMRGQADQIAIRMRQLNADIQQANWRTELRD